MNRLNRFLIRCAQAAVVSIMAIMGLSLLLILIAGIAVGDWTLVAIMAALLTGFALSVFS